MRVRSVLFVIAMVIASASACAKVTVRHVTAPEGGKKTAMEGVFYALPKTVVKAQVKIEKKANTVGPYMMFAPIFAPGASALCETPNECRKTTANSVSYSVASGATFTTLGEPDPAHVYLVELADGKTKDQTMTMAWTDTGVPTAAAASVTNRTVDVAVAGVKLATNLGTKGFLGAGTLSTAKTGKTCPVPAPADSWAIPELAKVGPPADASDLVIANYCDMDPKLRLEYQASDQALLEGAVVAFNLRVLPYAANRFNLLTTPTNALDPVELIDRLDTIIDAEIKKLFVGTSEKAAWEPTFIVRGIDDETLATPIELLQLDKANGPCPTVALAADSKPMPAGFGTKDLTAACKGKHPSATLTVALDPPSGQLFDTVKTRVETTAKGDRSFRYRIPAQVRATVMFEAGDRGSAVFSVAQLGEVVSLPAQRSSKTLSYDLAFIEATGGLKSFKLGSTGIVDAATIEAISDAGGTVLDARNKAAAEAEAKAEAAAAAAATAADELTIVTRQHTLLKLKHEICTIQKQYGLACTVQPSGEE